MQMWLLPVCILMSTQQWQTIQLVFLWDRHVGPSQNFLPGSLFIPVSAILQVRRRLAATSLTRWRFSGLATCFQSSRHRAGVRALTGSTSHLLRGFHVFPRPSMTVLECPRPRPKLRCHVCCWIILLFDNSSPPRFLLIRDSFFFSFFF